MKIQALWHLLIADNYFLLTDHYENSRYPKIDLHHHMRKMHEAVVSAMEASKNKKDSQC